MQGLNRDPLFVALTRPQMVLGVTFSYFVINGIVSAELFLIFKSVWVLLTAILLHIAGVIACLHEPRFFDIWLTRVQHCPRIRNHVAWRCNSYRA